MDPANVKNLSGSVDIDQPEGSDMVDQIACCMAPRLLNIFHDDKDDLAFLNMTHIQMNITLVNFHYTM